MHDALSSGGLTFSPLNTAVLLCYLAGMMAVGALMAKRQSSREVYFVAGRAMPWWPVALSLYASLTSATTYLILPSKAYAENIAIVVAGFCSLLAAPVLIRVVYPVYRRMRVTTSYEYLGARFGPAARRAGAFLFVLSRLTWLGAVVYAPSLALSVMTGWSLPSCILLLGLLATVYTAMGGLTAVLWTDVAQFCILVGGAVWVGFAVTRGVEGGVSAVLGHAAAEGRLAVFGTRLAWTRTTVWSAGLYFFLQMLQDYGSDQVSVQRMMAIRDDRGVVKALCFNAVTDFLMIGLLLYLGLGMLAYYAGAGGAPALERPEQILPWFVMHQLPDGVSGLLVTAILAAAMSSVDSGIHSLSTVLLRDVWKEPQADAVSEQAQVARARILTLVLGVAATGMAFSIGHFKDILDAFSTFISLFSAPVLALFLLGLLTRKGRFGAWVIACCVSIPLFLFLRRNTGMDWSWRFPVAFGLCFGPAWMISRLLPPAPPAGRP